MGPGRRLVYLSLPGLALVIGLCWLHRKRSTARNKRNDKANENTSNKNVKCTNSVCINTRNTDNIEDPKFKKSAAINIVQSGKSLTNSIENQIELENSKLAMLPNENKILNSIGEDSGCISSSLNLPDSLDNILKILPGRRLKIDNSEEPLIIKATTNAKVSPKISFLENKYTEEDQNIQKFSILNEEENELSNNSTAHSLTSDYCIHSNDFRKDISLSHSSTTVKMYEFLIPVNLISKLCGRKNSNLEKIKIKSNTKILLKKHPNSNKVKICLIEGTENEINLALFLIRSRLPMDSYPYLTMERVYPNIPQTKHSLNFAESQIKLVEGINNDVSVCAAVSAGHIFVHHPLHPSHQSLSILQSYLNEYYSNKDTPVLPEIIDNAICVGKVDMDWYRIQIINKQEHEEICLVKLLDFGGYVSISLNNIRQIRADFLLTPFQATECILSNIVPIDGGWSIEATEVLMQLTKGIILQAQVIGYNTENLPEIYLFAKLRSNCVISINKELVARNLVRWVENSV